MPPGTVTGMNLRLVFLFASLCGLLSAASPRAEIESLLDHVRQLDRAVFIRNGSEHTAVEAAAHMRMKWEKQAEKVKTAEDFIALCGTKSLTSGERYRIRFKDGAARDSAEVLREKLAEIRKEPKKP